jgi:endonuclease-3
MKKKPFDINRATKKIEKAIAPYKKAALFELAEDGFNSTFEQLIACMISIRTYDEVTIVMARRLFEQARTPEGIVKLSVQEIDKLIGQSTFHDRKAIQIREMARRVLDEFDGELPCDEEILRSFSGVGPKLGLCAGIHAGKDHAPTRCEASQTLLDRYQSFARAIRQTYLYRKSPALFHMSCSRYVSTGWSDRASLGLII